MPNGSSGLSARVKAPDFSERDLNRAIRDYLELEQSRGALWYTRLQTGTVKSKYGGWIHLCPPGTPDWLVIKRGQAFFFESKRPKGRVETTQRTLHPLLEQVGARVRIVRSLAEVMAPLSLI